MYQLDGELIVSPTDLTKYLACEQLTRLDLAVARGELDAPADAVDEALQILFTRGLEHERQYLEQLRAEGRSVLEIPDDLDLAERVALTEQSMAAGAEVIYQASFFDGRWRGHADFLLRRDDRPGRWAWSYDVADTKLARRMKVAALLQMATYAQRITVLQGIAPEWLTVVTGDGVARDFAFADCASYATAIQARFLAFLPAAGDPALVTPDPVPHCSQCRWQPRCTEQWRRQDDLSLVAGVRRHTARDLRAAGITTARQLGQLTPDALPATIGEPIRERLTAQARLQLHERDTGQSAYELLPAVEGRGLGLLPPPSPGDLFFDIEGDPFVGEHGLEYLFGLVSSAGSTGAAGSGGFMAYWATDRDREKHAFEQLVDHLMSAWHADPGMHVYHYAAYEPNRLKSLAARHATRGAEVDRLLRGERLVDLYAVVRQGLLISKESYSLKKVEDLYWGHARSDEQVHDAMGSVVAFERWLDSGDDAILAEIAKYNEDDCRSTEALRDWLESLRTQLPVDRPADRDGAPSPAAEQASARIAALAAALEALDAPGTTLLAGLLDWHRREALPEWWEYFARQQMSDDELVGDAAALGQLSAPTPVRDHRGATVWRMTFPAQETKVSAGNRYEDPLTGREVGAVLAVDVEQGWVEIARANAPTFTALVPTKPIDDRVHRARLIELAEWVLANGLDSPHPRWRAARDLLRRVHPRVGATGAELRLPDESAETALRRLALALDAGVLPVQGPPGTGKTWAGARTVLQLIRAGKRVGITGFSHKVVSNLLDAVGAAAAEIGQPVRILQRADEEQRSRAPGVQTASNDEIAAALTDRAVDVVAGTSWLFCRPALTDALDVIVVDEAGQLSLANVLALSAAGRSLVLLGDPQQLAQPVKGIHPDGADASALSHLLEDHATIPPDRGLLLDTTWRMHSAVAAFVSAMSYDGRLRVEPGCDRQGVGSASLLGGTGLRLVRVEHDGDQAASSAEADVVRDLCQQVLLEGTWTDAAGATRPLIAADLLVLTPFNAQVNRIRGRLDEHGLGGVRIGTVDKFQGQEAPVVIYSMASSAASDAPRGADFLYDRHRFTVAVSRARAVVAVVCSPRLLSPLVRSPEQLQSVNALCRFAETAETAEGSAS
jgi:uncharacterized protein